MEEINYIKHLNGIFHRFGKDNRLNPTHISLYIALFQFWNANFFKDVFYINRQEVMDYAKIGSKSTYHRCIKELSHWNYLLYEPSHNPFKGSRVKMFDFGTSNEQALALNHPEFGTSGEQELVPINKHIQTKKNSSNLNKRQNFKNSGSTELKNGKQTDRAVPYGDNLRTSNDKDYNEPL